jgi:hypothetical protein
VITKDEWDRRAELAAAAKYGEKHVGWYTFKRYAAGPAGIAAAAGAVGLAAYWLFTHVHLPSATAGHLPTAFWFFAIPLAIGTFIAFRPGRIFPVAFTLVVVLALLWLGLITYGLVVLI